MEFKKDGSSTFNRGGNISGTQHLFSWIILFLFFFLSSCTTAWKFQGSYNKTIQTQLLVDSNHSGEVYVNNKYAGKEPIKISLEYNQKIEKKTRKVSYWYTQPGWSLLVTILSLGIYLPFSIIPIDIETSLEQLDFFKNNEFNIEIEANGYYKWRKGIICKGEKNISLKPDLTRKDDE